MIEFDPANHPHRRFNPLLQEWILVSPHRTKRPWLGQVEPTVGDERDAYDPDCYLCPGNPRAGNERNPNYESTFVFENDFAALVPSEVTPPLRNGPLQSSPVSGECRVICFSPKHNLTLAEMSVPEIEKVVETWCEQMRQLGLKYEWVQVFENKGAVMGCSNPHPHGQVWAGNWIPSLVTRELEAQIEWQGDNLLLDCLKSELEDGSRVVEENDDWALWVPFWATWPYEYLLAPKRQVQRLSELSDVEKLSLSQILQSGLIRYDNLFNTSFPYSMGWHGAPLSSGDWSRTQLHAHFYPPLLRSATVRKFMVGYEMLAEAQRDVTPEQAAQRLREAPRVHYKSR